jgi:hypothetical protein
MGKGGRNLTLNPQQPTFGTKQLVSKDQAKNIKRKNLSFSFSYFNQVPNYFGIGMCSKEWHVGLIERLKTLGKMTPEQIFENNKGNKSLRCHPINWESKNVPIKRNDLTWLPSEILNNEEDFPIVQLSISNASGRIIGFLDRDSSIFHIVMLDPHHNIQPSKKTNYQIQPTTNGLSQYDDLLSKLDKLKSIVSSCKTNCELHNHIQVIDSQHDHIIYFRLDDSFYDEYHTITQKYSNKDIIEHGIIALMDKKNN